MTLIGLIAQAPPGKLVGCWSLVYRTALDAGDTFTMGSRVGHLSGPGEHWYVMQTEFSGPSFRVFDLTTVLTTRLYVMNHTTRCLCLFNRASP